MKRIFVLMLLLMLNSTSVLAQKAAAEMSVSVRVVRDCASLQIANPELAQQKGCPIAAPERTRSSSSTITYPISSTDTTQSEAKYEIVTINY